MAGTALIPTSAALHTAQAATEPSAPVFMVGTPYPVCEALCEALRQQLTAAGLWQSDEGVTLSPTATQLEALAAKQPQVRFIVLIDSPEQALAHWLAHADHGRIEGVLADWCAGARRLLHHAHRWPGRCLFLDAAEATSAPKALQETLGRWDARMVDLALPIASGISTETAADPLCLALAQQAVGADRAAGRLFDELQATCVELIADTPKAAPSMGAAIERYRALLGQTAAAEVDRARWAERVDALQMQIKAGTEDARGLRAELDAARQDGERLLLQLAQAQEKLEAARAELNQARSLLPQEQEARRHAEARIQPLLEQLDAARQEDELTLLQLHQVQEELEHYYLQVREHSQAVRPIDQPSTATLRIGSVRKLHAMDDAPHRHLHFEVRDIHVGPHTWPRMEIRLVEHHGRPGLALLATGSHPEPLSAWHPAGQEGERDYMLLVPADAPGRRVLQQLGSSDWQLVTGLARRVREHLDTSNQDVATPWRTTAARLCRQLADQPERLRYDTLTMSPCPTLQDAWTVTFGETWLGHRSLGRAALRWQASPLGLYWLAPDEPANLPLAGWPVDDRGWLLGEWQVPVGPGLSATDKRLRWAALSTADRALLLGLLDALPAAAAQAPDPATAAALAKGAAALHKEARRTLAKMHARSLVSRMLRRGQTGV